MGPVNLLPILYALLAALTGLSLGSGVVEEPRVAQSSLASPIAVARQVAGVVVRAASVPVIFQQAPVAPRVIAGRPIVLTDLPLDNTPARRRE
jgi:hypothetical protein